MDKTSTKTFFLISLIISILLSLSPILILLELHNWFDILDKIVLVLTAFFITFSNLFFQNRIQSKAISLLKLMLYTSLFNLIVFGINIVIRTPFWNIIPFHKPPLFLFVAIDLVRNIIIAFVSYWIISFFKKNNAQIAFKIKLNELEKQTLQLQLKNLTAQLQPHFFFNSLNVLSELIHIDAKKSDDYIQHLSNIFRYVLSSQETSIISLTDELDFIKSYLFLLEIRFENALNIEYHICDEKNFTIPSLCSLIVLENIVKHNNMNNIKISISTSQNESLLISNSKNKKKRFEVESLGLGLANIEKKCQLLLHRGIKINETEDVFEVEIPLTKLK
jgi:sensor histidine kinase YesM